MPETGTVPEIEAVTLPICAVPATNAGKVVRDTGCVPWKNVPLTGTVPLMLAVTLPICAVPADSAGSELIVRLFPTVTVPLITPKVTVESLASTFIDPPAET